MRFIVYIIRNVVNGKIYIGATAKSWQLRWDQHIMESQKPHNYKYPLHLDILKYGSHSFRIDEIEECDNREMMLRREIHWIKKLNSGVIFGNYNLKFGQSIPPYRVNKEVIKGIKAALDGKTAKWLCEKSGIGKSRFSRIMRGYAEIYPKEIQLINQTLNTNFKL